jgi:hypothetical protein
MKLADLPKYYQALIAFLGLLATFLTGVQTNEAITGAVPSNWIYGIGVGGSVLTAILVHARKSDPTPELVAMVEDIHNLLEEHKAQQAPAAPPVVEVTPPATVVVKDASAVLDDVQKVIATYKAAK